MSAYEQLRQWILKVPVGVTGGGAHPGIALLMAAQQQEAEAHTEERASWVRDTERRRVTHENDRQRLVAQINERQGALELVQGDLKRETSRAEAAEADNATLVMELRAHSASTACAKEPLRALETPNGHHGAALLEEVRRLRERLRQGLEAYHGKRCTMTGGPRPESPAECEDLVCREWAAEVKAHD